MRSVYGTNPLPRVSLVVIGQGVNRLIRALTLEDFSTEVLVPLEGLSSGVSQKPLLRYYLVIVSIFFLFDRLFTINSH